MSKHTESQRLHTIGAGEFITVWKEPDFDPALRAFHYVRVIEIPQRRAGRHMTRNITAASPFPARA
jgi:hypothetical protein